MLAGRAKPFENMPSMLCHAMPGRAWAMPYPPIHKNRACPAAAGSNGLRRGVARHDLPADRVTYCPSVHPRLPCRLLLSRSSTTPLPTSELLVRSTKVHLRRILLQILPKTQPPTTLLVPACFPPPSPVRQLVFMIPKQGPSPFVQLTKSLAPVRRASGGNT